MNQYPIEVLCYFAGIVDGEGCISIRRTKSQTKIRNYDYKAYIQIGMTSTEVLDWIVNNIGGRYYMMHNDSVKSKASYNWTMNPIEGANILKEILPYLILKRPQALVFIDYAKTIVSLGACGRTGLPVDIIEEREYLYQKIHQLNMKGNPIESLYKD